MSNPRNKRYSQTFSQTWKKKKMKQEHSNQQEEERDTLPST